MTEFLIANMAPLMFASLVVFLLSSAALPRPLCLEHARTHRRGTRHVVGSGALVLTDALDLIGVIRRFPRYI